MSSRCMARFLQWRVRARHAVPLLNKDRGEIQKNDSARLPKHRGDEWSLLGAQAGMPVLLKGKFKSAGGTNGERLQVIPAEHLSGGI